MSSETVTFTLNKKEVTVPKGWTVMQAVKREQIEIPYFCWHPGLSVAGVCRFCMVEVEGRPKLEIACNLPAMDGMVVSTASDKAKEAQKWGLEYHLINHPLDCPVCDQAGECGLQDYYMEVGKYQSQMERPKVLKPKAIPIGSRLVLDTERCILCDRCVRFESEVTKTDSLGIFDRGDRSIVGTFEDETIDHNYQENLVDICPVGAFTSKDFRFKQRVWFLEEKDSVCAGCSTGCSISVHGRSEIRRYYRVKPKHDPEVNGHWMCDQGRDTVKHLNSEFRLGQAVFSNEKGHRTFASSDEGVVALAQVLKATKPDKIALLVSPSYTCEEYQAFFDLFCKRLGVKSVYQWRATEEDTKDFDGILFRGDHFPNTEGLSQAIGQPIGHQLEECLSGSEDVVIALCPEVSFSNPSLDNEVKRLSQKSYVSLWTLHHRFSEDEGLNHLLPTKGFAEKTGTFLNYQKRERRLEQPFPSVSREAKDLVEICQNLSSYLDTVG